MIASIRLNRGLKRLKLPFGLGNITLIPHALDARPGNADHDGDNRNDDEDLKDRKPARFHGVVDMVCVCGDHPKNIILFPEAV